MSDPQPPTALAPPETPDSPPAAPDSPAASVANAPTRQPRAGQLTTPWQIMVGAAWMAAFFALAGVWKASEEVGIATWWLGPRADPQPILVRIAPFVIIVAVALSAAYNVRVVSWISLAGATAMAGIAAIDLSYMTGLAIAEFAIAGALGLVSLASLGGRYRLPRAEAASSEPETGPHPHPVPPTPTGPPAAR